MLYIILFILVLGIIILVHEFGHFLFAKRAGILCHEFAIGMGPILWKKRKGETLYTIRAIPLGGYVMMAGEEIDESRISEGQNVKLMIKNGMVEKIVLTDSSEYSAAIPATIAHFDLYGENGNPLYIEYTTPDHREQTKRVRVKRDAVYILGKDNEQLISPYERSFESKKWLDKFLTVVMGAGFNFIFAIILFFIIGLFNGVPTGENLVGDLNKSGLRPEISPAVDHFERGDRITELNDESVEDWSDISENMADFDGGTLNYTIKRDGKEITGQLTPLIYIATLGIYSDKDVNNDVIIGDIVPNAKADKEGFRIGDDITHINNVKVENWNEAKTQFEDYYNGEEITITVVRGNEKITKELILGKALAAENVAGYVIGINSYSERGLLPSIKYGFTGMINTIRFVILNLQMLFGHEDVGVGDLAGPLGIFDLTKSAAMSGNTAGQRIISVLSFMALISANIGFVNLLPIPALDGGRLIFLIIEGILRKRIPRKVENYIHMVGFILLMLLFVYVTGNDILRMIGLK
ncbi:RIP metalloprotease RseP [Haloplasma contractile]|uniref:Protease eep protein n=1 Tax=Haloplasma contractile SSD-17B TaxID=1033810 RepID=U2EFQ9_9MOLU|nr:RIP metalloprotease RseP [Haloplasma contractile]ERJ13476.1 putative protease eep protein [Haloplasma contractile SSD-17B]